MTIYVWPVGEAELVDKAIGEFIGAFDGYRFYRTEYGVYATLE